MCAGDWESTQVLALCEKPLSRQPVERCGIGMGVDKPQNPIVADSTTLWRRNFLFISSPSSGSDLHFEMDVGVGQAAAMQNSL